MRVLVLGARGMLGEHLVPFLRAGGIEVVTHARTSDADLLGDLADRAVARAVLSAASANVVVNLVAETNVDDCERNPDRAFRANVKAVEHVAECIRESRAGSHLVQVSTDQVYDGAGPHTEDALVIRNCYALSKYAGELAAASCGATVLRTNFFGRSRAAGRVSLSDWVVDAARRGTRITVFDDVQFSPLSMATISVILRRLLDAKPVGTFNVGARDGMSKADFAFALCGVLDLPTASLARGSVGQLEGHAPRPRDMRMDVSRVEDATVSTMPTLLEEIRSMRDDYATKR